jgi:acyl-CoA thioester hydrolase
MTQPFVWQLRVYWEDTDAGGVVYHSRYLNFFERARTEWLRSRGIEQSRLARDEKLVFAISRMEVDFLLPAVLDDELDVSVHSVSAGRTRLEFSQELTRRSDGRILSRAQVRAACLDADSFKPARMPDWIQQQVMKQRPG